MDRAERLISAELFELPRPHLDLRPTLLVFRLAAEPPDLLALPSDELAWNGPPGPLTFTAE